MSGIVEYTIHTHVVSVTEMFRDEWLGGVGAEAKFVKVSLGYFLFMQGSHEAIGVGPDKPTIAAGDPIEIIIRKRNAQP